jgi:hypothetical protein
MNWLLAQSEEATAGVGVLKTILDGGPLLILAVLVVVEGYVIYHQSKKISKLETDYRDSSVSLLKDQIRQSEPLTHALTKTNDVLGRVETSLKDASSVATRLNAKLDAQERSGGN